MGQAYDWLTQLQERMAPILVRSERRGEELLTELERRLAGPVKRIHDLSDWVETTRSTLEYGHEERRRGVQ